MNFNNLNGYFVEDTVARNKITEIENKIGQPRGIAELDDNGRIPTEQLTLDAMRFRGKWNPNNNSLQDGQGDDGDFYISEAIGSCDFGNGTINFLVNDKLIYNGERWEKIPVRDSSLNSMDVPVAANDNTTVFVKVEAIVTSNSDSSESIKICSGIAYKSFYLKLANANTNNGLTKLRIGNTDYTVYYNGTITSSTNYSIPAGTYFATIQGNAVYIDGDYTVPSARKIGDKTLEQLLGYIYPVGSIYISTNNNFDPNGVFPGVWQSFGAGRTLIGYGTGTDSNSTSKTFNTTEASGGEYTHKLTTGEIAKHTHSLTGNTGGVSNSKNTTEGSLEYKGLEGATPSGIIGHIQKTWGYGHSGPGGNKAGTITIDIAHTHSLSSGTASKQSEGDGYHNNMQPYIVVKMWKRQS